MTRVRAVWIGLMVLTVAACSGGGSADPTVAPSTAAATTSTTSTTAPASPSSTTSVTTTVPPTTVAPTTSPTTSPPTTVPVDPTDAVIADFLAAWEGINEAKLNPQDQALVDAAASRLSGVLLPSFLERIDQFRANNWRSLTDDGAPASATIVEGSVIIVDETATLAFCDLDSNVLVEVGALPDGGDAVVDESIVARLSDATLRLEGDRWLLVSSNTTEEFPGSTTCGG